MNEHFIARVLIDWNQISSDSYLRYIDALYGVEELIFDHAVTFFVGENGTGKSTLMEGIAVAHGFNAEGGTKNYSFSTYDSHSELCDAIRVGKGPWKEKWGYFLRAESFYNVASYEEETSREGRHRSDMYHFMSHGESFLSVTQQNLMPQSLYLFDEPEAALSPQRQLTLLIEIYRCMKQGLQFIIATHSPILLGLPGAEILSFDGGKIHPIEYEETSSYQVTEMFMNNREGVLHQLLDES